MFTCTLLTSPALPGLTPSVLAEIQRAWAGSEATWLAPSEAASFEIADIPDTFWDTWRDLQARGIDLIAQPGALQRKKMLLADMDSTMIEQECIDELADMAGVGGRVKDITARAMKGELDFEAALRERVALLTDLPEPIIADVIEQRITFMPGGPELLATMRAHGAYTALVSGGFTAFTQAVAAHLGFDEHRANTLLVKDGKLTGAVGTPILGQQAKVDAMHQITEHQGIEKEDVIAVGDGANDIGMLHQAGLGVALHAKPAVAAQSNARVNFGDLTALLYLQGYRKADFVSPG